MNSEAAREYGMPLPGPIEVLALSAVTDTEVAEMLRIAVCHVGPIGGVDREVLRFIAERDTRVAAVVASLLVRAWQAGHQAGRLDRTDLCRICGLASSRPASTVCVGCEHKLAEGRINDPEDGQLTDIALCAGCGLRLADTHDPHGLCERCRADVVPSTHDEDLDDEDLDVPVPTPASVAIARARRIADDGACASCGGYDRTACCCDEGGASC